MANIEIRVRSDELGNIQFVQGADIDERGMHESPEEYERGKIAERLDQMIGRVKAAYGIESKTLDPTELGMAVQHLVKGFWHQAPPEEFGRRILEHLAHPEVPVPDAPGPNITTRSIRDQPQA